MTCRTSSVDLDILKSLNDRYIGEAGEWPGKPSPLPKIALALPLNEGEPSTAVWNESQASEQRYRDTK